MKRILPIACLTFLVGLFLGLFVSFHFPKPTSGLHNSSYPQTYPNNALPVVTSSAAPSESRQPENAVLVDLAYELVQAIKTRDYSLLASHVSSRGVRLTPYSTVDLDGDVVLSAAQVAGAAEDTTQYHWGYLDGIGEPISMTIAGYFADFVFNADYTLAPHIGVDTICQSGNALENVTEAYPDARFVEFHFPGLDPKDEGLDWCSLKLVFEQENGSWRLVGLIHSQWTI